MDKIISLITISILGIFAIIDTQYIQLLLTLIKYYYSRSLAC